jgi:ketosteroid isomerase-like protein
MKFAVCLCLCLGLATLGLAANADETKILALENAWNQAQLQRDSRALDGLVADTFIYTDTDGSVMNKAQFLADNKDPNYKASLVTNEDEKVFSYSNTAVVIGTYHTKGTYKGKAFDHYGRFTDTWIFQDGTWRCVASHTTLVNK